LWKYIKINDLKRESMNKFIILIFIISLSYSCLAQDELPLRGLAIAAPDKATVDRFVKFINEELAPRKINTLVLRVDNNFEFKSHPELSDENPLSQSDVDKIVKACQNHNISIVPQINLLGHQSWASKLGKLLEVYPEFDETPGVKIPEEYKWPNDDGLYCKSYCPLHPEVHKVVFALMDEIMEAFQADAFHAGMDEVFYIGDKDCPRCNGLDKAELFAGEVSKIHDHLALKGYKLWIWGDRLLDGKTTGMGMWEASMNNTHRAIDLIPKDVMICDWHYERVDPTAVYFAMKGFNVATSSWRKLDITKQQLILMQDLRKNATPDMKDRYQGMVHTVWSSASNFMDRYYASYEEGIENDAICFKALFQKK